jgi:hypothetical protein
MMDALLRCVALSMLILGGCNRGGDAGGGAARARPRIVDVNKIDKDHKCTFTPKNCELQVETAASINPKLEFSSTVAAETEGTPQISAMQTTNGELWLTVANVTPAGIAQEGVVLRFALASNKWTLTAAGAYSTVEAGEGDAWLTIQSGRIRLNATESANDTAVFCDFTLECDRAGSARTLRGGFSYRASEDLRGVPPWLTSGR